MSPAGRASSVRIFPGNTDFETTGKHLSKQTAQSLQSQGLPVVNVLINGWNLWLKAGYPVAKGKI
jgi:hypothetical protein